MALLGDILGHLGIACFLGAYFLMQQGRITHDGAWYLSLNLVGALLMMASLAIDWNLSAFVLEAAWALISIYGIYRHLYQRKRSRS